jgi:hypothetical protein
VVSGAAGTVVSGTAAAPVVPGAAVESEEAPSEPQAASTVRGTRRKSAARRNDMCVSFAMRDRVVASAQRATVALRETRGAP